MGKNLFRCRGKIADVIIPFTIDVNDLTLGSLRRNSAHRDGEFHRHIKLLLSDLLRHHKKDQEKKSHVDHRSDLKTHFIQRSFVATGHSLA